MIKLYNTLTRKNEELRPINGNLVKMYSCGPTVYHLPHIGSMRAYIFMYTLRRVIKYNGYQILGVMNITDVGHLTSDSDDGEDKMEQSARKENKTPMEIAKYYTDIFLNDLKMLNVDIPEHITKATDYVPKMIEFIKKLEQKGYTYKTNDGIYFDVYLYFNLCVDANIVAGHIINALDIEVRDIKAWDISASEIYARNINAQDIIAYNIYAQNIIYWALCFAYNNIKCKSIKGTRENHKHLVLDGKIEIENGKTNNKRQSN